MLFNRISRCSNELALMQFLSTVKPYEVSVFVLFLLFDLFLNRVIKQCHVKAPFKK